LSTLDFLYGKFADSGITRNNLVIAFGGGVVGDLTGFAAATYMRGIPYVQIPTTVMSQLDSSIGGKTAVNISAGKNLAGCFYQPKAVYIDTELLGTLADNAFADGMAEAVKYGATKDRELFMMLRTMESLKDARDHINEIIYRCAAIKCHVVSVDEFDKGERMLLNFGHTIGHGIERCFEYATYTHGEAVSLGMLMITRKSEALGLTKPGTYEALKEMLVKFNLPTTHNNIDADELLTYVNVDKKSAEGYINLILLREIGSAYVYKVPKNEIMNFIK
jgi:3-dehydroquinate synthase